jgi:hypothetical protein
MRGLRACCAGCLSWLVSKRLAKPLDPTSALAKALEAYPATAIDDDDDGDGDENEPMPIEEGLDRTEPGEA